jgi:glycosyltransferase involved in cell wall biosynthesis
MRVLIMAGRSFASRERRMLQRLEVGLADEGIRVVHAIPRGSDIALDPDVFAQATLYDAGGLPITRAIRARRLVEELESLPRGSRENAVDIVHAFGEAWHMAAEVARIASCAIAVDFWSLALARRAAAIRAATHHLPGVVFLAPNDALERAVRRDADGISVRVTPWGVHCPPSAREVLPPGKAPAITISAAGVDRGSLVAALEGLAKLAKKRPDVMVFLDAHAARKANVWPTVRALGLEKQLSLTPLLEGKRELALRTDMLLLPEAPGEFKSIVLDAMATGLPVIAASDPMVTCLHDRRNALLVGGPDPDLWADAVGELLDNVELARSLAAAAREHIRKDHRVSSHIATVIDAYEWMTAGDALRLPTGS